MLIPVRADVDRLLLHGLALGGHALLVGVEHDLREVVGVDGVEHIEEVLSGWAFADWVFVREVAVHVRVLLEFGPERLHGELVVVRHLDGDDLGLLQQVLLAGEDVLQEVLVDDALVGQVEL